MTTTADWSGRVGEVWAEEWPRTERAFADLAPRLEEAILAVAPRQGRFLDIGCGVGGVTRTVARARTDADVLGVDLSPGMIEVGRQLSMDLPNLGFICADILELLDGSAPPSHPGLEPRSRSSSVAEDNGLPAQSRRAEDCKPSFDLLFSRHGVMFFPDPTAAFARLHDGAAPGAPLLFTCFADVAENPWATLITEPPAPSSRYTPGPFAFADRAATRDLLLAAGWRDPTAEKVVFRYRVGEGTDPVEDALAFLRCIGPAASLLRDVPPDIRVGLLKALRDRLERQCSGNLIEFPAAAWLWTAQA